MSTTNLVQDYCMFETTWQLLNQLDATPRVVTKVRLTADPQILLKSLYLLLTGIPFTENSSEPQREEHLQTVYSTIFLTFEFHRLFCVQLHDVRPVQCSQYHLLVKDRPPT